MTDNEIIFHWLRSTKNFGACRALAHLSQHKIADIIHLICESGYMGAWTHNKHITKIKGDKNG